MGSESSRYALLDRRVHGRPRRTLAAVLAAACLLLAGCSLLGPAQRPGFTGVRFEARAVTLAGGGSARPAVWADFRGTAAAEVTGVASGTVYQSSDELLVTVDATGTLHASPGGVTGDQAVVTATFRGRSAELTVTIVNWLAATIEVGAGGLPTVTNPGGLDVVVSKTRNLPTDYVPPDLQAARVTVLGEPRLLRRQAAVALEELFAAATAAGHRLVAISGYRSYQTQAGIFARNVALYGEEEAARFSARPGQSEHQTGLAVDVSSAAAGFSLVESFGGLPEGVWVAANAHRFGFVVRYPQGREDTTGYAYEPWHLRYVGAFLAAELSAGPLTLEEYFAGSP